jgi:hypothetical protein
VTNEPHSSPASSLPDLVAGKKLSGCYLLDRALDTGSEFPIWLAQDEVLGKSVSLHFLPSSITQNPAAIDELRTEIKRSRALIHPNVLRVYDLVEEPKWTAVAMEAFEGRSLAALLKEKKHFEVNDVEPWLDQVCVTLEEAHRLRLTHRDLAPENLFLTSTGKLLLAYFGIGRTIQDAMHDVPGATSRLYTMSPQLLEGDAPTATDDVYGVGALLFELLAGRPVFVGGDILEKIQHEVPPRLSEIRDDMNDPGEEIPKGWENVISACLNKASDERPHRPSEIVSSIEAYLPPVETPAAAASAATVDEAAETVVDLAPPVMRLVTPPPATAAEPVAAVEPAPEPIVTPEPAVAPEPEAVAAPVVPAAEIEKVAEIEAVAANVETEEISPKAEVPAAETSEVPSEAPAAEVPAPEAFTPEVVAAEAPVPAAPTPETPASEVPAAETPSAEAPAPEQAEIPAAASEPLAAKEKVEPPLAAGARPAPRQAAPYQPYKKYDTDEDAFSSILPKRFRFPAAVGVVLIGLLAAVSYFYSEPKEKPSPTPVMVTTEGTNESELTSVKNSVREPSAQPDAAKPEEPAPIDVPTPKAAEPAPETRTTILAANTKATPTPAPSASSSSSSSPALPTGSAASSAPTGPVEKQLAEKAAALDRLKQEVASAEQAQATRVKDQQAADAAVADAKKAIDDKTKAAAAAKKTTEELLAARKKREEDQKAAESAAQAAQQLAVEKARAAEEAKKALADFETQNREKLAAGDKVDSEIQALQLTLAERQKASEDFAKSTAAAQTTRQQQLAAIQQTEQEVAQLKANAAKSSAEDEKRKQAEAEKRKLDDELASMRAMFEQRMKDIEDRRKQLDGGAAPTAAPAPSTPAPAPIKPLATPDPKTSKATATPAPAPTLPLMAMKTEPPAPALPTAVPATPAPAPAAGGNSLGLRFVPVGDVQFSVWQTRVKDFELFAKAVNLKSTAWRGPGFRQGPDHPVVNVTWTESIAFCKWLTDKEHKEGTLPANQFYRLPYDMEWSKAVGLVDENGKTPEARDMGVPDVYPWGTDWPPPKGAGNYTGEETGSDVAIKGYDDGFAWTSPVGSFPPNKFGIYDMGGNVWQWCMDSWNNESKAKVLRGASWYNGALKLSLLSSCRVHASPDSSTDNYGFRIVKAVETASAKPGKK